MKNRPDGRFFYVRREPVPASLRSAGLQLTLNVTTSLIINFFRQRQQICNHRHTLALSMQ